MFVYRFAQVVDLNPLPHVTANSDRIQAILAIVFTITGAIALLIVTLAGFRYVLSRGNPQETAQAKNAILYAVIGLLISISAFAIVTFVIGNT